MTADLALTVDGDTTMIRVADGQTVADVLAARDIVVGPQDVLTPDMATVVSDGLEIEVGHARLFTATIDGQKTTVSTTAATIDGALLSLGIDTKTADISLPPQTLINEAPAAITVTTQKMISVRVDGRTLYTRTMANDVGQVLTDRNITLGSHDKVKPDVTTTVTDDMSIVVQRVTYKTTTVVADVPFKVKKVNTSSLPKGSTRVTTAGVKGKANQTWQITLVDGVEQSRQLISQTVLKKPITEVMQVGTKGSTSVPKTSPGSAQDIARQMLGNYGWSEGQLGCLISLWNHESHWNVYAQNKSSGAYGIPQALPGSKMASAGSDWRTSAKTQIKWGLGYIKGRYGSPCGAWSFYQKHNWY